MSEQFPISFGRYRLLERLAVGGMAELFLASHSSTRAPGAAQPDNDRLVIKRLLPHMASQPHFKDMFLDEAKLTKRLMHPKIAQTYDFGRYHGQLFIAMEFVDGIDALALLRECAHRKVRLPPWIAVYTAHEVLDALDFAHNQFDDEGKPLNVVHRDISPSNVLLSRSGDIKLVDFGIARAAQRSHHTKDGTLKGKYGYMSPEQVIDDEVDARSDLFSAGILLAELLMGRRLFAAPNELDVLLMVRDAKLDRLDRFGAHIGLDLDRILRKALRKRPDERFASASEFRDALADWAYMHDHVVTSEMITEMVDSFYTDAWMRRRGGTPGAFSQSYAEGTPTTATGELEDESDPCDAVPTGIAQAASESYPVISVDELDSAPVRTHELSGAINVASYAGSGSDRHARPGDSELTRDGSGAVVSVSEPSVQVSESITVDLNELMGDSLENELQDAISSAKAEIAGPNDDADADSGEGFDDADNIPKPFSDELETHHIFSPEEEEDVLSSFQAHNEESDEAGVDIADNAGDSADDPMQQLQNQDDDVTLMDYAVPQPPQISPASMQLSENDTPPDDSGGFSESPPIGVLYRLAVARATGLLIVAVGGIRKEIFFREGIPEYVSSNVTNELFGEYLVSEHVISSGELSMALAVMPRYNNRLGDTLVSLNLLTPLEVLRHLTRQVRKKLIDVCTWVTGTFEWYAGRENQREAFPLDLNAFEVLAAGALALSDETIESWLEDFGEAHLAMARNSRTSPEVFQLGPVMHRICAAIDGQQTCAALCEQFIRQGEYDTGVRILYLLSQTGLAITA